MGQADSGAAVLAGESWCGSGPGGAELRPVRRSQDELWERNLAAARQFHAREGHLRVPRQHREDVDGELLGLGSFISNARRRAAGLSPERRAALTDLGMRW
ncbi:helicase associated domain-containing protein [Bacillus cereus]|uniref:helicase associated domain-containing protein n=1 Tax=Bacillati TaxID=1783272 RepID=UPI00363FF7C5